MPNLVRPIATMSAYFESIDTYVALRRGDAWDADDPIVRERPDLFQASGDEPPVEQATAAPGEKRTTRRTTK